MGTYARIGKDNTPSLTIFASATATQPFRTNRFSSMRRLLDFLTDNQVTRSEKRKVPLFSRGACKGPRKKANLHGPFPVILDVDKSETSMLDCSAILEMMGVDHIAHTTWSHAFGEKRHSYRVFVDWTSDTWEGLENITRQIFDLCGIEATRESWQTLCYFVPAMPKGGKPPTFRHVISDNGSSWEPEEAKAPQADASPTPSPGDTGGGEGSDALRGRRDHSTFDAQETLDALAFIPNFDRDKWYEVGMSLHATGLTEAREVWDAWSLSQDAGKYDPEDQERVWRSFGKDPNREDIRTIASIFKEATDNGWKGNRQKPSAKDQFQDAPVEEGMGMKGYRTKEVLLAEMNANYAYLRQGNGRIVDFDTPFDDELEFVQKPAFYGYHEDPKFGTGAFRANQEVKQSIGEIWFHKNPEKRVYKKVEFLPPGPRELPSTVLNLWRGYSVEPDEHAPGGDDCGRFLEHIYEVICAGNEDRYEWTLRWLAQLFQKPQRKPQVAIVLKGAEGLGKGLFAQPILNLYGSAGLHITDPDMLTSGFNAHMSARKFVFGDEVFSGGGKRESAILKTLITEKTINVQPKGIDRYKESSYLGLVMASNSDWVVPAGELSRRFTVFDVSAKYRRNFDYFKKIARAQRKGALQRLLYALLHEVDLTEGKSPQEPFLTDALMEQKELSMGTTDKWLHSVLKSGEILSDVRWNRGGKFFWVASKDLVESYIRFADAANEGRRSTESILLRKVHKRLGVNGEKLERGRHRIEGVRVYRILLPALHEARIRWESHFDQKADWDA